MARIAIVVGPGFEDSELTVPRDRLATAGHEVHLLGVEKGEVVEGKRGESRVEIEAAAGDVEAEDYDALVVPGGHSPDKIRTDPGVVSFVRDFVATGRPIAAVCHGPQLLIEVDAVRGKRLTSWPSVRKDLENAGAEWIDQEVVEDPPLITSRKPDDLDAFTNALLERLRAAAPA